MLIAVHVYKTASWIAVDHSLSFRIHVMPFESQNFMMKVFYVPLKPFGFFHISHCFMVQDFLSPEDKWWVSLVISSLFLLDFCSSNPANLKCLQGGVFSRLLFESSAPFFVVWFSCISYIKIWCAVECFSSLHFIWCLQGREEKKEDCINLLQTQPLCLSLFTAPFDTSTCGSCSQHGSAAWDGHAVNSNQADCTRAVFAGPFSWGSLFIPLLILIKYIWIWRSSLNTTWS